MIGVVVEFGTLSCVTELPPGLAKQAGCTHAQVMIRPGAFDKCLRRCTTGRVEGNVRLQFQHVDETKVCSTLSGSLKLWADQQRLYFGVTSSTRDGRHAVKWARFFKDYREVSAGYYPLKGRTVAGTDGEPDVLVITEAELFEVSIVPAGAFPNTRVRFI